MNRQARRAAMRGKLKGHKLDFHHIQIKRRRAKKRRK